MKKQELIDATIELMDCIEWDDGAIEGTIQAVNVPEKLEILWKQVKAKEKNEKKS